MNTKEIERAVMADRNRPCLFGVAPPCSHPKCLEAHFETVQQNQNEVKRSQMTGKYNDLVWRANHQGIACDITCQEWYDLWDEHWEERGRAKGQYLVWRKDKSKGWNKDNLEVILSSKAASLRSKSADHAGAGLRLRKYKDETENAMFLAYIQMRNQANFRHENWDFSEKDWMDSWRPHWAEKGRKSHNYAMSRLDNTLPWSKENVFIATRREQLRYVSKLKKRRHIQTPNGVFQTQRDAAHAYGIAEAEMNKWRKENPKEFYYINGNRNG